MKITITTTAEEIDEKGGSIQLRERIKEVLGPVEFEFRTPQTEEEKILEEAKQIAKTDRTRAIYFYRNRAGCDLFEAYDAVTGGPLA